MPASRFTKKAKTPKQKRQWQHVYDSELAKGASRATAVKAANGVVKKGVKPVVKKHGQTFKHKRPPIKRKIKK